MNRQEIVNSMEWLTRDSGSGMGICSVANSFLWGIQRPSETNQDLKSIVAIRGPASKYTDAEIVLLYGFSRQKTAEYDEMFRFRLGANLIIIDKKSCGWLRKRMTWDMGEMYSKTLADALAVFGYPKCMPEYND